MGNIMDFLQQFFVPSNPTGKNSMDEKLGANIAGTVRTEAIPKVWRKLLELIPEKTFMRLLGNNQTILNIILPIAGIVIKQFSKMSPSGDVFVTEGLKEFMQQVEAVATKYKSDGKTDVDIAKMKAERMAIAEKVIKAFTSRFDNPSKIDRAFKDFSEKLEKINEPKKSDILDVISKLNGHQISKFIMMDEKERDRFLELLTPEVPEVEKTSDYLDVIYEKAKNFLTKVKAEIEEFDGLLGSEDDTDLIPSASESLSSAKLYYANAKKKLLQSKVDSLSGNTGKLTKYQKLRAAEKELKKK